MLVLSRKSGESIVIGENIRVTVLEMHGNRVKLGVSAPGDAPIHRFEIHQQLARRVPAGGYAEAALA